MPSGIYIRTEKHRLQCIKNLKDGQKSKHLSEETKKRLSIAHTGKIMSLEAREKMSKAKKGIYYGNGWKKGQHPSPSTEFKKGHIPWSKLNAHLLKPNSGSFGSQERGMPIGDNHPYWKGGPATYERRRKRNRKVYHCRRRTWEENGGELTYKILQLVYENNIKKYGTLTCYLCYKPLDFGKDSVDHKIPLSKGGTNQYNNLAISCRSCNAKKSTKTLKEYRRILNEMAKK